jgi:hypothetical protein
MLYYIQTGDIDTSTFAESHRDAAAFVIKNFSGYGQCVVVSDEEMLEEQSESYVYFLTEAIIEDSLGMRIAE